MKIIELFELILKATETIVKEILNMEVIKIIIFIIPIILLNIVLKFMKGKTND